MNKDKKFIWTGILTAVGASLCCITPVLALISGASGVASAFSWLEPLRPYLIGVTIVVLAFAWYQKLKPQNEIECDCETDEKPKFMQTKLFLALVTGFAVLMLSFPYYSKVFYSENKVNTKEVAIQNIQEANVDIKGMTCESCNQHVEHSVFELPGIIDAKADFKTGKAMVKFDKSKIELDSIVATINATGYKVLNFKVNSK